MRRLHSLMLIAAAVAASTVVTAQSGGQGFHFVEQSNRLPADTNTGSSTTDIDLVDVDGDGDLDIYVTEGTAGFAGRPDRLLINQALNSGIFVDESDARLLPRSAANSTKTAFGDLDGDGDLDALVANVLGEDLLINNGSGVFTLTNANLPPPVVIPPTRFDISADVALADVDNDGDLDAILANENPFPGSTGDQSRLWLNNGSAVFTDATNLLPQRIEQTIGILTGDIDSDGDLDIIALNRTTPPPGSGTGGQDRVYINQINLGNGFVDETATRLPVGNDHSRGGSLADLNGDGALDLVVGNSMTQPVSLYFNDGTGVFVADDFGMVPASGETITGCVTVDLDGDGDLDVYLPNAGPFLGGHGFDGQPDRYFRNNGRGKFKDRTRAHFDLPSDPTTAAAFGDVDGDGDLDLVVGNTDNSTPGTGAERLFIQVHNGAAP
jgi:FG-GAP-like repeat